MKRYIPLFEKRLKEYKAWYNPQSDFLHQFSSNGLHSEQAEEQLGLDEIGALKAGYYRIFVGHEVNIDSWKEPTEREFMATKYMIEENSFKKFQATRWDVYSQKGFIFFPNQSFLFADSLDDGMHKKF